MGMPLGFATISYAHYTIINDYIKYFGEVFQFLPTKNAYGSDDKHPIEKEPDTIIVQNVNAKVTIYSMWIILRKCEEGCVAH